MLKVFDAFIVAKNDYKRDRFFEEADVEKLDAMLTEFGVEHIFTIPRVEDFEEDEQAAVTIYYIKEQHLTLEIVYALFLKTQFGWEDKRVAKALANISTTILAAE